MAHYQNQYDPARQTDEYGNPVGQKDDYGNPIGHHTGTTGGEYGTVGYETAPTGAGKYGGAPGSGTYNKEQHGNQVGERDEYGNPIGHHNGTTGGEYGTVGYETATTEAGKYPGAPGSGTYNKEQPGNPVGQRDEYGNPIGHYTGTTGGEYGTAGYETAKTGAGKYGGAQKEQHCKLHRSRSSGSSSSEDDGQGGRTKKGIKEKLPGTGQKDYPSQVTSGGYYSEEQRHEKKGIMDKIKEKLPGHHDDH